MSNLVNDALQSAIDQSAKNTVNTVGLNQAVLNSVSNSVPNQVVSSPNTESHQSSDKSADKSSDKFAGQAQQQAPQQAQQQAQQQDQKKLKVIIGLPGDHFSQAFLLSWTNTIYTLVSSNRYDIKISPGKSSFVPFARMHTLGLDVLRGKSQKAFHNEAYDVFVSIDSDVVFSPIQLIELIECTKLHPVVSGYYMMQNNKDFAVVKEWSKSHFAEHGTFKFLQPKDTEEDMKKFSAELEERKKAEEEKKDPGQLSNPNFLKVSYAGMGFFACRKEVLDALAYPFFNRELQRMRGKDGVELVDMCSEDVAFCKNIEDAGFDIMLNTRLRVGHEKSVVL
jgi:hypothetical protein